MQAPAQGLFTSHMLRHMKFNAQHRHMQDTNGWVRTCTRKCWQKLTVQKYALKHMQRRPAHDTNRHQHRHGHNVCTSTGTAQPYTHTLTHTHTRTHTHTWLVCWAIAVASSSAMQEDMALSPANDLKVDRKSVEAQYSLLHDTFTCKRLFNIGIQ